MYTQKTAWGQIEWLTNSSNAEMMNLGIVSILPHVSQEEHIHYANEQFIYILQGEGIDVIDGEFRNFSAGDYYYIPANVTHRTINVSDKEIRHIIVSVYVPFSHSNVFEAPVEGGVPAASNATFCAAVEAIRGYLAGSALPISIFDDMGNMILQSGQYPDYCVKNCNPAENHSKCLCFRNALSSDAVGSYKNVGARCPYGLTVFQMPIIYENRFLGSIFSGHILSGGADRSDGPEMYDTPAATTLAIQKWVSNVAESILSFCRFSTLRNNLAQGRQAQVELEASLGEMKNTVLNLKVNRHFLFNTLNSIAAQMLQGDRMVAYKSITDLSRMFRYSTSVDLRLVPLREELDYLQTYLHLQKLRYGDSLHTAVTCPETLLDAQIPFNFLQPIVENSFTHGFTNEPGPKHLSVQISHSGEKLLFCVENNGIVMDKVTITRVLNGMSSNSGHGLSLIYAKLERVYGSDFSIDMTSGKAAGTRTVISIPYQGGAKAGDR